MQESTFIDPYKDESSRGYDLNVRNKMSSFKKVLLDYLNLNKRANIALFKKVNINENGQTIEKWVEFGRPDLDQNCKYQRV